jgi:hypothetical protein
VNWIEFKNERKMGRNVVDHIHDCILVGAGPAGPDDPTQVAPEASADIPVEMTAVGGEIVYSEKSTSQ